jgi:hypothetical protein
MESRETKEDHKISILLKKELLLQDMNNMTIIQVFYLTFAILIRKCEEICLKEL